MEDYTVEITIEHKGNAISEKFVALKEYGVRARIDDIITEISETWIQ